MEGGFYGNESEECVRIEIPPLCGVWRLKSSLPPFGKRRVIIKIPLVTPLDEGRRIVAGAFNPIRTETTRRKAPDALCSSACSHPVQPS